MKHTLRVPYMATLSVAIVGVIGLFLFGTALGQTQGIAQSEKMSDEEDDPSPIEAADEHTLAAAETETHTDSLTRDDVEILWLARILYSETKRADEQRLVAWIVRNRVETNYRGSTYKQVALSAKQFSGLHAGDAQYYHNISRTFESEGHSWKTAVDIAREVYWSDGSDRPFSVTVRHFYSPKAVVNHPHWSKGETAVHTIVEPETNAVRFAFYDGIR